MKETDAIIIMRNYLWMHRIEMSHTEKEALQRIIDALVLYRTEARGNCNQVATNLQLTCNVLISRADAMGAVQDHFSADGFKGYDDGQKMMDRITGLPSAETHDKRTETHGVCSDCISRQQAVKAVANALWHYPNQLYRNLNKYEVAWGIVSDALRELPPVTPTERTGEWIPVRKVYRTTEADFPETHIEWETAIEPDDADAVRCSECGEVFDFVDARNWCSECGTKMGGDTE